MTEAIAQFATSNDAKIWLENQTTATLAPVQTQAKKLRDDMNLALQLVADVSKQLFDISNKEIERHNMKVYNRARALNKLSRLFIERLKKLIPPEQISYDTMSRYMLEIRKVFYVTDIDLKNWFPRISPFFIMDRRKFLAVYEKARQVYNTLNDYVNKEYVKTKTLEEAILQLNELQGIEKQLFTLQEDRDKIRDERVPLEQEISELEQKISNLKSSGPIDKLNLINAEIENLTNELRNDLRHLQKPFIKMQALATSGGGGGITPDELTKINQYIDTPFDAIVQEPPGYPRLKEILEKLERMMTKDTLKLKPDKARKAEQSVNDFLQKNILDNLQLRCKEMATKRDHLLASSDLDEINRNLAQYQEQLNLFKARKTSVETHEIVKSNSYHETVDKISGLKRIIEKNVYAAIDKKIQLT
ncbi:hypothetical protein [Candidatus Bathycorpusculum sp.]|uniref:hypothetical protein n=1 Tax=Candidatus Bathycorpusculum sp. TaxID=2994959 RepID=UPI00281F123D|nr:hypothetical protein [Candidatus Termitimicrobium sp.]MCL2431691.1 hypothetical protein [Candidatus Termitimicrobium sp.]